MGQTSTTAQQEKKEAKKIIPDKFKDKLDERLENAVFEEKDFKLLKQNALKAQGTNKPLFVLISTKKSNYANVLKEEKSETSSDIKIIDGKTNKEIKQELTDILNKLNPKYDAIIILLICVCFVGSDGVIKFFYPKDAEPRHIEKLKKDIVYRLDETAVFFYPCKAVIFSDDAIYPKRPSNQMEQSEPNSMITWKKFEPKTKHFSMAKKETKPVKDQMQQLNTDDIKEEQQTERECKEEEQNDSQ